MSFFGDDLCQAVTDGDEISYLVQKFSNIEQFREVIANYKQITREKLKLVSKRIYYGDSSPEDFNFLGDISRTKKIFDENYVAVVSYDIRDTSNTKINNVSVFMLPVCLYVTHNGYSNKSSSSNVIYETITLGRTTLMMETNEYAKLRIKSNTTGNTTFPAEKF